MAATNYKTEVRDGLEVMVCLDCARWCRHGEIVRHSSRCDHSKDKTVFRAQDAETVRLAEIARGADCADAKERALKAEEEKGATFHGVPLWKVRKAAREGWLGTMLTDEQILDAVRCGHVSQSDAMNQDF